MSGRNSGKRGGGGLNGFDFDDGDGDDQEIFDDLLADLADPESKSSLQDSKMKG